MEAHGAAGRTPGRGVLARETEAVPVRNFPARASRGSGCCGPPPFPVVIWTWTVPGAWGGAYAVMVVRLSTFSPVAARLPNQTLVPSVEPGGQGLVSVTPGQKLEPVIVTCVRGMPDAEPEFGD